MDTIVSEEHAAPFFKAEVSRMKMLSGCYMKASHTHGGWGGEDGDQSKPIGRVYKELWKNCFFIFSGIHKNWSLSKKCGSFTAIECVYFPSTAKFLSSNVH
jgi:hypothetical protein